MTVSPRAYVEGFTPIAYKVSKYILYRTETIGAIIYKTSLALLSYKFKMLLEPK